VSGSHPCTVCPYPVSAEFGCSHFGFFHEGRHVRHALCCAQYRRLGSPRLSPRTRRLFAVLRLAVPVNWADIARLYARHP
jgi:hypothetical protein